MSTLEIKSVFLSVAEREKKLSELANHKDSQSLCFKDASQFSYTLSESKGGIVGHDHTDPSVLEINEKEMWAEFKLTQLRRDHHGDIVEPKGCLPFLSEYEKNAQVFFSHRSSDVPIAKSTDANGKLRLRVTDEDMVARAYFHNVTQESVEVFKLITLGYLKGASIGFVPVLGEWIERPERKKDKDENKNEIDFDFGGIRFKKWKLLEWSVVPIPANADAIRGFLSREKSLSPITRNFLSPYAAERKAFLFLPGQLTKEIQHMSVDTNTEENKITTAAEELTKAVENMDKVIETMKDVTKNIDSMVVEATVTDNPETKNVEVVEKAVEKSVEATSAAEMNSSDKTPSDDMPYGCSVLCKAHELHKAAHDHFMTSYKKIDNEKTIKFVTRHVNKFAKAMNALSKFAAENYPKHVKEPVEVAGIDNSDDDEPEHKSLFIDDSLVEVVEFLKELAEDNKLTKAQKAACKLYSQSLKSVNFTSSPAKPQEVKTVFEEKTSATETQTPNKEEAHIVKVLENCEKVDEKIKSLFYKLFGTEM